MKGVECKIDGWWKGSLIWKIRFIRSNNGKKKLDEKYIRIKLFL